LNQCDVQRAVSKLEKLGLIKRAIAEPCLLKPDLMNDFVSAAIMPQIAKYANKVSFDSLWSIGKKPKTVNPSGSQCYLLSELNCVGSR
jgi:hypothetical protein